MVFLFIIFFGQDMAYVSNMVQIYFSFQPPELWGGGGWRQAVPMLQMTSDFNLEVPTYIEQRPESILLDLSL